MYASAGEESLPFGLAFRGMSRATPRGRAKDAGFTPQQSDNQEVSHDDQEDPIDFHNQPVTRSAGSAAATGLSWVSFDRVANSRSPSASCSAASGSESSARSSLPQQRSESLSSLLLARAEMRVPAISVTDAESWPAEFPESSDVLESDDDALPRAARPEHAALRRLAKARDADGQPQVLDKNCCCNKRSLSCIRPFAAACNGRRCRG